MKPKIKKKSTYSILFMRDDSGVARFRMLGIWLKLLCWMFAIFAVGSAAGGWGSYYYWNKYRNLAADYDILQQEAAEYKPRLEQLNNIEKLRRAAPLLVNEDSNATAPALEPHAQADSDSTESLAAAHNATAGNATAGNATMAEVTKPEEPPIIPPIPQPTGEQPAKIANASLRSLGSNTFRLSFDLVNQSQSAVTGKINLSLVTSRGMVDLPSMDEELRFFRIMNFKKINTTFSLPPETARETVVAVQVAVEPDRNSAYVERILLP